MNALVPVAKAGALAVMKNKDMRNLVVAAGKQAAASAVGAIRNYARGSRSHKGRKTQGMSEGSRMYRQQGLAVSQTTRNGTQMRVSTNIKHKEWGSGIRVTGTQYLTSLITDATTSNLFSGSGASVGVNYSLLSPDALNGRLALLARNYERYAFRKVVYRYVPRCASTQAGGFALAYSTDCSTAGFATLNYARTQDFTPSVESAFREVTSLTMTYSGDQTWFTELDLTSDASSRLTIQGALYGYPDASSIGAVTQGHIHIDYVVDFFGLSADYGFSVSLKSQEERDAVQIYLAKLRKSQVPVDDFDRISLSSGRSGR